MSSRVASGQLGATAIEMSFVSALLSFFGVQNRKGETHTAGEGGRLGGQSQTSSLQSMSVVISDIAALY